MARQLIDYLPQIIQGVQEYRAILMTAEQPEIEAMWIEVSDALNNQFLGTAGEYGVRRWEAILGIKPKAGETLDQRKFTIMSRLNESLPYTIKALARMLTSLCGEDGYTLELTNASYTLRVKVDLGVKSKFEDVNTLLHKVVPANMVIDLELLYNTHEVLAGFTHAELARYTHDQLRNEVITHAE